MYLSLLIKLIHCCRFYDIYYNILQLKQSDTELQVGFLTDLATGIDFLIDKDCDNLLFFRLEIYIFGLNVTIIYSRKEKQNEI